MRHESLIMLYLDQKNKEQKVSFVKDLEDTEDQDYLFHSSAADKACRYILNQNIGAITTSDTAINNNEAEAIQGNVQDTSFYSIENPQNIIDIAKSDINYNGEKHFARCSINLNDYKKVPSFVIPTSHLCLFYNFTDPLLPNIIAFTIDVKGNDENGKSLSDLHKDIKLIPDNVFNETDITNIFNNICAKAIKEYEIEKVGENNLVSNRVHNFRFHTHVHYFLNSLYGYMNSISAYSYLVYYLVHNFCFSFTILLTLFNSILNSIFLVINELLVLLFAKYKKAEISDRNNCDQATLSKVDQHLNFFHRVQKIFLKLLLNSKRNMFTLKTKSMFRLLLAYIYSVYDTWVEQFKTVLFFGVALGLTSNNIGLVHTFYVFASNGHLYKMFLGFLNMMDFISKEDYDIKISDFEVLKHQWSKQQKKHCIKGKKANSISSSLDEREGTVYNTFGIESKYHDNNIFINFINPALIHHYLPCKFHLITANMYKASGGTKNDIYSYDTKDIGKIAYMMSK